MVNLATKKILITLGQTQIPSQCYYANPLLAAADSLVEGIATKTVTADKDVSSDIETHPHNSLPQYSPS